jgi:hypothetical protein
MQIFYREISVQNEKDLFNFSKSFNEISCDIVVVDVKHELQRKKMAIYLTEIY